MINHHNNSDLNNLLYLPLQYSININTKNINIMKIVRLLSMVLIFIYPQLHILAQKDTVDIIPGKGKVSGRIFANFYTGIGKEDKTSAFEVRRAYFGYKAPIGHDFTAEVKLDIGSPNDLSEYSRIRRYAYFKTAALYYQHGKVFFKFGIFDIDHFDLQEKFWNHRYIYKSFQDEHRFGNKADLGTSLHYKFLSGLSADITIMNGEGYTDLQRDNAFKTGTGITFNPNSSLLFRVFVDFIKKKEVESTISTFAGYSRNPVSIGLEYNHKFNKYDLSGYNQNGISSYIMYRINDRFEVFARYDRLASNILPENSSPWNLANDGSAIIGGIQYQPVNVVKVALDYQDWYPYASNMDNLAYIFVHFEILF